MKGKLTSFFTGVIAALLLVALPVSALAVQRGDRGEHSRHGR